MERAADLREIDPAGAAAEAADRAGVTRGAFMGSAALAAGMALGLGAGPPGPGPGGRPRPSSTSPCRWSTSRPRSTPRRSAVGHRGGLWRPPRRSAPSSAPTSGRCSTPSAPPQPRSPTSTSGGPPRTTRPSCGPRWPSRTSGRRLSGRAHQAPGAGPHLGGGGVDPHRRGQARRMDPLPRGRAARVGPHRRSDLGARGATARGRDRVRACACARPAAARLASPGDSPRGGAVVVVMAVGAVWGRGGGADPGGAARLPDAAAGLRVGAPEALDEAVGAWAGRPGRCRGGRTARWQAGRRRDRDDDPGGNPEHRRPRRRTRPPGGARRVGAGAAGSPPERDDRLGAAVGAGRVRGRRHAPGGRPGHRVRRPPAWGPDDPVGPGRRSGPRTPPRRRGVLRAQQAHPLCEPGLWSGRVRHQRALAGGFVGIHGTDRPDLLPGRVLHGCIRMRNEDILRLAELLPIGTPCPSGTRDPGLRTALALLCVAAGARRRP